MNIKGIIGLVLLGALAFPGCNCHDERDSGWQLDDEWPSGEDAEDLDGQTWPDAVSNHDPGPPDIDEQDAGQPDISGDDAHSADDTQVEPDAPWQPEEVEPGIPNTHALTDRTSLAVDPDGTLWLGYHHCRDRDCTQPMLRVVHKPVGGDWVGEDIRVHEGIFGLDVVRAGEPIVAFPDSFDPVYRVKMRDADGDWTTHDFPTPRSAVPDYDGFDITQNGRNFYISLAPDDASKVSLFRYEPDLERPVWEELEPLRMPNPQAAMERGLRADESGNVYLVNRSSDREAYGVYRYDPAINRWPQAVEFQSYTDVFVHSLFITQDARLCLSGSVPESGGINLLATCGSMVDLTQDAHVFYNEYLSSPHPSSIIEGHDGTLYIAFNPEWNDELRVASRRPGAANWTVETVYDGPSYGVSTAIDLNGDLVISFYTCDDAGYCSLKVVWETLD